MADVIELGLRTPVPVRPEEIAPFTRTWALTTPDRGGGIMSASPLPILLRSCGCRTIARDTTRPSTGLKPRIGVINDSLVPV